MVSSSSNLSLQSWTAALDRLQLPGARVSCSAYAALLRFCGNAKALSDGKRLHQHVIIKGLDRDVLLRNVLIQMYGDCGSLGDARACFALQLERDQHSWNFLIAAYARNGQAEVALSVFGQMLREDVMPNKYVFASALSACANQAALAQGQSVHAKIVIGGLDSDVVVANALVTMYSTNGSLEDARLIFDKISQPGATTWTAMISAYAQHELGKDALELYDQMHQEGIMANKVTFVCLLSVCAGRAALAEGKNIHAHVVASGYESFVVVGNALLNMYGKCGCLEDAEKVFHNILEPSLLSWTTKIAVYAQHGKSEAALQFLDEMQCEGIIPDEITFAISLSVCAYMGALGQGRQIHACIVKRELQSDVVVGTALVSMYAKCGSVELAWGVFREMNERNAETWNAMIAATAQHGLYNNCLRLFHQMLQAGESPDKVTFVCILSACSFAGLVDEGCQFFASMKQNYGITPSANHCNCLIDLLARAGCLKEAEDLITNMPCQATPVSWMTLLGNCRDQIDMEQGEHAAKCVFELDAESTAPHIVLSNMYDAMKVKKMMWG